MQAMLVGRCETLQGFHYNLLIRFVLMTLSLIITSKPFLKFSHVLNGSRYKTLRVNKKKPLPNGLRKALCLYCVMLLQFACWPPRLPLLQLGGFYLWPYLKKNLQPIA